MRVALWRYRLAAAVVARRKNRLLAATVALALVAGAAALPDLKGAWVFHLRRGTGAEAEEMTLFTDGLVAGGKAWRGPAARDAWRAVAAEVCDVNGLERLLAAAGGIRVAAGDAPQVAVDLDVAGRQRLVDAAGALGAWSGAPTQPPPSLYPHYQLEVLTRTGAVNLRWEFDHVVAAWQTDTAGYGQADFLDRDLAMWHVARAEGGPLAQAVEAPAGRVSALVCCLLRGRPATGGEQPPGDETPVVVTFSDVSGRLPPCQVLLYADGFVVGGRYYQAPGVQQSFLTTMSAG